MGDIGRLAKVAGNEEVFRETNLREQCRMVFDLQKGLEYFTGGVIWLGYVMVEIRGGIVKNDRMRWICDG